MAHCKGEFRVLLLGSRDGVVWGERMVTPIPRRSRALRGWVSIEAKPDPPRPGPIRPAAQLKQVDSVCPYCGVGCAVTLNVDTKENEVVYSDGRAPSGNDGRLSRRSLHRL